MKHFLFAIFLGGILIACQGGLGLFGKPVAKPATTPETFQCQYDLLDASMTYSI